MANLLDQIGEYLTLTAGASIGVCTESLLRRMFDELDPERSGFLCHRDYVKYMLVHCHNIALLKNRGEPLTDEALENFINEFDVGYLNDGAICVHYDAFLSYTKRRNLESLFRAVLHHRWKEMVGERSEGCLRYSEVIHYIASFCRSRRPPEEEMGELFGLADPGRSGLIRFDKFYESLSTLRRVMETRGAVDSSRIQPPPVFSGCSDAIDKIGRAHV